VLPSDDAVMGASPMLEELRITSLGVIESSTLELSAGLTAITGETGAGKTMVVTALGLLLGGRADSGAVRSGDSRARVEGVLDVSGLPGLAHEVDEAGGEVEDGRVVLARNVAAEGRSRAWVGGASVPVSTLGNLAAPLVAVHGQSDQHRLLQPQAQRRALDLFGGDALAALVERWAELWDELAGTQRELDEVVATVRERALEADQLRFGLGEIETVDPQPGEDVELAAEESRLGHADTLRAAAERAREALSSQEGTPDALAATAAARSALDDVRDQDEQAAELADRVAEVGYLLTDLATDVASYAAGLESDPARLAAVSQRRAELISLTRKYGSTVEEVLDWAKKASTRLLDLDDTDGRIAELRQQRDDLREQLARVGEELSACRAEAAGRLSRAVSEELTGLAMPHARLRVEVRRSQVDPQPDWPEDPPLGVLLVGGEWVRAAAHGIDEVELLLAANRGSEPRPLGKGASGGELSRVMLALELSLAETGTVPTFVFDEIDAGVGGKAAIEIGRRLARLAKRAQVIVVTHLPQVAAFADQHVVVHKASDGSVTTSGLTTLGDDERVRELSRMLAGLEDSESALNHARELMEGAAPERACLPDRAGRA